METCTANTITVFLKIIAGYAYHFSAIIESLHTVLVKVITNKIQAHFRRSKSNALCFWVWKDTQAKFTNMLHRFYNWKERDTPHLHSSNSWDCYSTDKKLTQFTWERVHFSTVHQKSLSYFVTDHNKIVLEQPQ